ncbi:hypothetical protein ACJIZ3_000065 [Penstemon smallii]|uniref:Uncharacterized protein n=1 Tax=Penstemon smallii TaxID=265156 RepID=A0ABD3RR79_9LAMI
MSCSVRGRVSWKVPFKINHPSLGCRIMRSTGYSHDSIIIIQEHPRSCMPSEVAVDRSANCSTAVASRGRNSIPLDHFRFWGRESNQKSKWRYSLRFDLSLLRRAEDLTHATSFVECPYGPSPAPMFDRPKGPYTGTVA